MIRYIPENLKTKEFLSVAVALDTDGFPIVDVSPCFLRLKGYSKDQVIGQNCRFYPDYKDLIFTLDTQTLCEYTR
ncbi:hypothetical protein N9L24_03430 [Candidatus Marinamargulisbacteria bacterium]|jgi:hypothetical protein|nr:hypothetical protein [Candidatus Marinamargulisbacteria bacterium]